MNILLSRPIENIILITGIINLIGILAVFFTCRFVPVWNFTKGLESQKWYKSIYKYHSLHLVGTNSLSSYPFRYRHIAYSRRWLIIRNQIHMIGSCCAITVDSRHDLVIVSIICIVCGVLIGLYNQIRLLYYCFKLKEE